MSNGTVTGYIGKVFTRPGIGPRGPYASDNILLKSAEGEDIGWFGVGFRKNVNVAPNISEGQHVTFKFQEDQKGFKNVDGPIETVAEPVAQPATAAAAPAGKPAMNSNPGMNYGNARTTAAAVVKTLLEHDALPITKTAGKANQAVRYETVIAAIDKLTVKYYFDGDAYRLLDLLPDEGLVDVSGDGALPDADPAAPPTAEELEEAV
jgi:hypothetical protein